MTLVNYLGTYDALDQVWEIFPEGGKEGDYLYVAGTLKKWDKYTSAWIGPSDEDLAESTIATSEEDVIVGSSTLINYLGRFEALEDALNVYPEGGNEGDYLYVGDVIFAWNKYANEWVVSNDTPISVVMTEDEVIPNSTKFINYLGGFVDRATVWQKYPEGGNEGDYIYIDGELYIWDKYINNWVAATPPDESSQIRPIEYLAQDGVVEYSENYINYLGVFDTIEQAWEVYPEGGKEGDYIIVGGEQLRWNKYTSNWGEYDPDASTPARPMAAIFGDLHVFNDVIIGEELRARILETFTTKKWVLEQGYISLKEVTSELVMSKIVPDNTTIEVRDGKLVVIGGGGGVADSVAWSNITDKPEWIGAEKPSYTLDEIMGSSGDGFVTLLDYQEISGVKNFKAGVQFDGLSMYKSQDGTVYLDANLVLRGNLTMFGKNTTTTPSIFDLLPIDNDTIKRNENGQLYAVAGGGGGVADSVAWSNITGKPDWVGADKPSYSYSEITGTPDLGGFVTAESLTELLKGKADKATKLAEYGITDAYTQDEVDAKFEKYLRLSGEGQSISAIHDFTNGLLIDGLAVKKSQDKTIYIDGNLVVSGAMTMFGKDSTTFPTIWANIPFNPDHMTWNGSQWSVVGGGGSASVTYDSVVKALGYTPLNKTGDILTVKAHQYTGLYGIDMQNSNIVNLNAIFTADVANDPTEGIQFKRSNGNFDSIWASDGALYFSPNGNTGMTGDYAITYNVLHTGNYTDYVLSKQGGEVNGQITSNAVENFIAKGTSYSLYFGIGTGQVNRGIYDMTNSHWWIYRDATLNTYIPHGNVAIGGTTASERLSVYGNATIDGKLELNSSTSVNLNSAEGILCIGSKSTNHISIDANDIQAKSSPTTAGTLYLNTFGGKTVIGSSGYNVAVDGNLVASNTIDAYPIGSIHRIRLVADNAATYLQAGSSDAKDSGVLRLTGYYASQLQALKLHAVDTVVSGHIAIGGALTFDGNDNYERLQAKGAVGSYASNADAGFRAHGSTYGLFFGIGSGNVNRGIYDDYYKSWWLMRGNSKDTTLDGNLTITGAVTFFSQASLKNIINHEGLSLDELAKIRPARFKWKDGRDDRVHVGAIADEIVEVLPEVVYHTGEEKTMTMDYASAGHFIATSLIKPVIDHETRIKYLEAEVKTLKQENNKLKQLVA